MGLMLHVAVAAAVIGGGIVPAVAQAAAPAAPAPATDLQGKPGTLSDKLSGTGGVIKPKGDVDPDIRKSAPQAGTMPVIKPGQIPPQSGDGGKGSKGGLY